MIKQRVLGLVVVSMFLLAANGCPLFPAPVPRTGQLTSYVPGDDGDLQIGVVWPDPRFTDNEDGTVTDNLTGLIWLKESWVCFGSNVWEDALDQCYYLADGQCGLTDGSAQGDWRMPNIHELFSLIDFSHRGVALPKGHPFEFVEWADYWSSTTHCMFTSGAWIVDIGEGSVRTDSKSTSNHVWPVRGGQ